MNKVKPIKDGEKLRQIQEELGRATDPHGERMFLLFEVGIHTGLRISDLVRLRCKHVQGDAISTVEKKTGKRTTIPLDAVIQGILRDRLRGKGPEALLFPSRNRRPDGTEKPITTRSAYADMRLIARQFALGDAIGCHTLRKTFGYWHYKHNRDLEMLRQWFSHASQSVTLRYIGMDDEEKRRSVRGFNPGQFAYEPREAVSRGRSAQESEALDVEHLDRSRQGQIWGERAKANREKKKILTGH